MFDLILLFLVRVVVEAFLRHALRGRRGLVARWTAREVVYST